jgi:hypothetical protein
MTRHVPKTLLLFAAIVLLAAPGTARAAYVTVRQLTPGITTRTIWDSARVACYRLPDGVNHRGYIHLELAFKPALADMDLYLLDAQGKQVGGIAGEQGYLGYLTGRETVDYRVDHVTDTSMPDPSTMVGDTYYVLAVAFNETAKVRITGYYPQIDLRVGSAVDGADNYLLRSFSIPRNPFAWLNLTGPASGEPYAFRPMSEGQASCRLEWPADVEARSVVYDQVDEPQPASMGQYLYAGASWTPVFEDEGAWAPPPQDGWWGLLDGFEVRRDGPVPPREDLHYVPNLYAVASDATLGGSAPPKTGLLTRGFKATVSYPENLRITGVGRSGGYRSVRGTFALGGEYVSGARVILERKAPTGWVDVKSTRTSTTGAWAVRFLVTETVRVRAKAVGDPSGGLAVEYSSIRTIKG